MIIANLEIVMSGDPNSAQSGRSNLKTARTGKSLFCVETIRNVYIVYTVYAFWTWNQATQQCI